MAGRFPFTVDIFTTRSRVVTGSGFARMYETHQGDAMLPRLAFVRRVMAVKRSISTPKTNSCGC